MLGNVMCKQTVSHVFSFPQLAIQGTDPAIFLERTLQMAFLIGDTKRFTDVLGEFSGDFKGDRFQDSLLGWVSHPLGVT